MTLDAIAQSSLPISAYMTGHAAANLAYVRYFGKKEKATKATFISLDAHGFTLQYDTPTECNLTTVIPWPTSSAPPLRAREQVRPLLEAMAKEAEEALGLPSSLSGPPPLQAMLKAQQLQQKMETEQRKQQEEIASRDIFQHAAIGWQVSILLGMWVVGHLAAKSRVDTGPWWASQVQQLLTLNLIQWVWRIALTLHIGEAVIACCICLNRRWYSTENTIKWTFSTLLFGFASMKKLIKHGKEVHKLE